MAMFWIWIAILVLAIVGVSVLVGRALSKPSRQQLSRHDQMTALKASGALKNRKESRR